MVVGVSVDADSRCPDAGVTAQVEAATSISQTEAAEASAGLQFTNGEGRCLHAHHQTLAIMATEGEIAQRWPTFHAELTSRTPYRSITSFPVHRGLRGDAAVDMYFTDPQPQLPPSFLADAWSRSTPSATS